MTKKLALIYASARHGKTFQDSHPRIGQDYRSGMTLIGIADKYHVGETFGVKSRPAKETIVHRALWGCNYDFRLHGKDLAPYEGQLDRTEMSKLSKEHMAANGKRQREDRVGIFGLTKQQRTENSRKAGKLGGSKGGRQGHINRGNVLWEDIEILVAGLLTRDPEYHAMCDLTARVDRTKIARKLNELCHNGEPVRDAESTGAAIYRERKYLKNFLEFIERTCS